MFYLIWMIILKDFLIDFVGFLAAGDPFISTSLQLDSLLLQKYQFLLLCYTSQTTLSPYPGCRRTSSPARRNDVLCALQLPFCQ